MGRHRRAHAFGGWISLAAPGSIRISLNLLWRHESWVSCLAFPENSVLRYFSSRHISIVW